MGNTVNRSFFRRDAADVAKDLLGCVLVHGDMQGRIVETEAYYGEDDPASHAYQGMTERNEVMFGPAGVSYIYICYGIHQMLNITTGQEGTPEAVLLRAVEPLEGLQQMRANRGIDDVDSLCDGPGKLCEAFGIDKTHNDIDLTGGHLHIERGTREGDIAVDTRIGINEGTDMELRFYLQGNSHVSR
jgi:DNA-3-methyladenine glycosylase